MRACAGWFPAAGGGNLQRARLTLIWDQLLQSSDVPPSSAATAVDSCAHGLSLGEEVTFAQEEDVLSAPPLPTGGRRGGSGGGVCDQRSSPIVV